ncbi:MAG TPA: DUF4340 domain-containing protein [Candidatus Cloacimonadota bacterium]|nr:DUF4340 domain-containing protein [Candidatus Cloacimonadota bacterium]HOD53447.1 DUF4340 domain-containing protein [Candidatus Cloacimonadota bacterium]HPM01813.1 DUF4340 domain-containing protein [Candidatus Cloacimonadota bacterium]
MSKKTMMMLGFVLILLLIVLYFHFQQPVVKNMNVFDVDSLQVYHIEISSVIDTVLIEKINEKWILSESNGFPANPQKVSDIFHQVLKAKRSKKILSDDFKKQDDYQVSPETGIRIRLLDKNQQLVSDFYLGLSSFYTYSSLRFADSDLIYELDRNLSEYIFPSVQMWKDPVIIPIKSDSIKRISVNAGNNVYRLENREKSWYYKSETDSFNVFTSNRSLFKILNILQNLQSVTTFENTAENRNKFTNRQILKLDIELKSGQNYVLKTWVYDDENCLIETSANPSYFYLMHYDFANRFTKAKENFLDYSEQTY